jgi:hypothetical protein
VSANASCSRRAFGIRKATIQPKAVNAATESIVAALVV